MRVRRPPPLGSCRRSHHLPLLLPFTPLPLLPLSFLRARLSSALQTLQILPAFLCLLRVLLSFHMKLLFGLRLRLSSKS